ncbi:uncharacterized protein LOC111254131 isoform X1 [Varroa destructor]|uniref:Uncharacterized protein n=2 Tax=Varroa destructor TaxID=109461 RepID=A0A7M7KTC3_VARDE|nr:uncharacterized protein LOC111254131 isoform X1 [Varroa destructor]
MRHNPSLEELAKMLRRSKLRVGDDCVGSVFTRKISPEPPGSSSDEMAAMQSLGGLGSLGGDLLNQNNQSEAGPEVALFNNGQHANDALNFNDATTETTTSTTTIAHHRHSSSTANIMQENVTSMDSRGGYDSRTITKQTLSKLQINSKFGTFTRRTCESIEKFNFNPEDDDDNSSRQNGMDIDCDGEQTIVPGGRQRTGRFSNGFNNETTQNNDLHQRHLNGESPVSAGLSNAQGVHLSDSDLSLRQLNGGAMLHDVKAPRNGSPNANRKLQSSPQQPRRGSPSRQPTKQVEAAVRGIGQIKPSAFVSPLMMTGRSHGSLDASELPSAGICSENSTGGGNYSQSESSCGNLDADSQTESALLVDARLLDDQVVELEKEVDSLKIYLNDALAERDQAVAALRAYEELLKRINEANAKQKRSSTSSLGSGSSSQKDAAASNSTAADSERLKKKNAMLEKTVDNLEQTVQDTMARMNDVKDVNQELKTVLTDQQDMLAQYKSTIEQKTFEYKDLLAKHEAHIDALVTEHKRDRALLEKQITLLRAEAHMKSLDNERLASECRIKGEQLARMTEMLNELRQAY